LGRLVRELEEEVLISLLHISFDVAAISAHKSKTQNDQPSQMKLA
jgi:hypothetical protein